MATIRDIAKILVERHKMKTGVAEEFLQMLVEVINEGLVQDRIVKIKGFGTFKLQEVKERKSVNVNTGESVVIAAHDKVSFTPDSVMRDLVNKPFAQFETVIVGDENPKDVAAAAFQSVVEAEASVEKAAETPEIKETEGAKEPEVKPAEGADKPEAAEVSVEKVAEVSEPEKPAEEAEEPKADKPVEKLAEEPKADEPKSEEPVKEEYDFDGDEKENDNDEGEEEEEEETNSSRRWLYILAGIVLALVCFALGYLASHHELFEKADVAPAKPAVEAKSQDTVTTTPASDTLAPVPAPVATPAQAETPGPKAEKAAETQAPDMSKYNSDPRVKYGAYIIIGTETTVKVLKGQTLKGISKAYLGPDMECYVEAYNGGIKTVKEGDKVLIPKLQLKKKKKK